MRNPKIITATAAGVALAGMLAACSGTTTAAAPKPAAAAARYTSAQQVIRALDHGGLHCTDVYNSAPPTMQGAASEATCSFGSDSQENIDVFPGTVTTAMVLRESVSTGTQQIWSDAGPNWLLMTDSAHVKRVQKILGGRVIGGPWHPAYGTATTAPVTAPATTAPAAPATTAPATTAPAAPAMTAAEQQAVSAAQSYLSMGSGFSQYSLTQQLTSSSGSGFASADAQFAISYLHPNWDAQAVDAAKGYMQTGGFSASSLTQQLTSDSGDGFTPAQAAYAVAKVGL
jgi:hypothetical protein